jgi:hypothetical protein
MMNQQQKEQNHEHEEVFRDERARHEELASDHRVLWLDDIYNLDDEDQQNQEAIAYKPLPPISHEERHSAHQADVETNLE